MEKAIDRIRDEMAKNAKNPAIQYVGEYLTEYLQAHPAAEGNFADEKKSIEGAMKAMENVARGRERSGDCVCIDPEEGLKIVLGYYGITDKPAEKPKTANVCASMDLDALLGL